VKIGECKIGQGHDVYVIAEIGVNHNGSLDRAIELVDLATNAGADAVKFQAFRADRLMSAACELASYQQSAGETDASEMLSRLELSTPGLAKCVTHAHSKGLHAIVTPFTLEDLDDMRPLGWDAYKTASPDIINKPLLDAIASTRTPMIVSTGASTIDEIERAIGWLSHAWDRLCFLQCVSSYPTDPAHAALRGIAAIARRTRGPVGYSDHTSEITTGAIAVGAGAEHQILARIQELDRKSVV